MLAKNNQIPPGKYRYISTLLLVSGPIVFLTGALFYGYNKISGIQIAQTEWKKPNLTPISTKKV